VAGVVTIQNPRTADIPWSRMATARFQEAMSLADAALADDAGLKIGVTMNPEHADKWFAGSGHDLKDLLALVDAGKPLPRFPLSPTLRAKAYASHCTSTVRAATTCVGGNRLEYRTP